MLKVKSNTNRTPRYIKDLLNRENYLKSFLPTNRIYNSEEWYIFISSCVDFVFNRGEDAEETDALTSYIYKFFKERKLFDDWFYENIEIFEESDLDYYYDAIKEIIDALFVSNNYKYRGLFESTILEFNPLWNVDGVETTTRTLEQDGTIETTDTGTNTIEKTGTDTLETTGTDINKRTGTDTLVETGTDANAHTGTQTLTESGTDANAHTGTQTTTRDADNDTTRDEISQETTSNSPFNDNAFYNAEKRDGNTNISENNVIDESDVTTFNDTNTETKNLTNQTTFNDTNTETKNLQDQRTYNVTDTDTKNLQDERTLDLTDVETKDLTNLMTRDLLDTERIIIERRGNIGITTTTKLLTEFREFVYFNFLDVVAHDVVNVISYGVY